MWVLSRQWALDSVRTISIGIASVAVGMADDAVPVDFWLRLFVLSCGHAVWVVGIAVDVVIDVMEVVVLVAQ